jgi:hypothetical protein
MSSVPVSTKYFTGLVVLEEPGHRWYEMFHGWSDDSAMILGTQMEQLKEQHPQAVITYHAVYDITENVRNANY